MELRHLKYFVCVAEERNFNRAAARLRVSQPAISRQIADFEGELGVLLLQRNGHHGVELTSEGELMLAHARAILRRVADATEAMQALRKAHRSESLVIGYIAAENQGMLTSTLRRFEQLCPKVEFNLVEMHPQAQLNALLSGQMDVALLGSPWRQLQDQVALQTLQRREVVAVVDDHHRLASRSHVALDELSGEAFVGLCEQTFPGRNEELLRACQGAGFMPSIRYIATGLSDVFALVAAGKGVSLIPSGLNRLHQPQTVFLKLKPPVPALLSVAALRKDDARLSVKKLIELCREEATRTFEGQDIDPSAPTRRDDWRSLAVPPPPSP